MGAGAGGDLQAQMLQAQQQLMSNPQLMQQLMESPLMQSLLANPDTLQSMLTSNPQIQQLMEVATGHTPWFTLFTSCSAIPSLPPPLPSLLPA